MFEITHVEHEQPFYQLSNLPVFRCRAHLFEYNDEDFDTGVDTIQDIEERYAYQYALKLDSSSYFTVPGNLVAQTLPDGAVMSGEVMKYSDSDDLLFVGHVGSSDGLYRNFVTSDSASLKIRISGNGRNDSDLTILSVTDSDNKISENEQNAFFSEYIDDFLDFSESNPFGDPENN